MGVHVGAPQELEEPLVLGAAVTGQGSAEDGDLRFGMGAEVGQVMRDGL